MGKILYIRLDSSPLPEPSDEIIIKDFNLESYFCTLLGKRLLEEAGLSGAMPYPGKLITDFEKIDGEAYRKIIRQWEKILSLSFRTMETDTCQPQCFNKISEKIPYVRKKIRDMGFLHGRLVCPVLLQWKT